MWEVASWLSAPRHHFLWSWEGRRNLVNMLWSHLRRGREAVLFHSFPNSERGEGCHWHKRTKVGANDQFFVGGQNVTDEGKRKDRETLSHEKRKSRKTKEPWRKEKRRTLIPRGNECSSQTLNGLHCRSLSIHSFISFPLLSIRVYCVRTLDNSWEMTWGLDKTEEGETELL